MDIRAILLVSPAAAGNGNYAETLGGTPIALLPALGRPVVQHVAARLKRHGIESITVVSDPGTAAPHFARLAMQAGQKWLTASGAEFWRAAENAFSEHAQAGAELVLLMRLGPYAEIPFDELIQFHLERRQRVTSVVNHGQALDAFVISASRRNDAAFLLRHQLASSRTPCSPFPMCGYLNRLLDAHDLRQLVTDAFGLKIGISPAGRQWKPGVWVEDGARIHGRARILAPAFVGARSKIRAAAVLTRGTCVEHHCEIDCGTVVEDSTLLPFTAVGAGLDIAHSVVGFGRLAHLRRSIEVEIDDPKLLSMAPAHPGLRALSSAARLATYLPKQILCGLFAKSHREPPLSLPESVNAPPPSLTAPAALEESGIQPDADKFPADLIVARRYGDQ